MNDKLEIIVDTIHGKIPLEIYNPNFTWRELVFPPIRSITVKQGNQSARFEEYTQYNFLLEVTQETVAGFSDNPIAGMRIEPRRFWIFGNVDMRVEKFEFHIYRGVVTGFNKTTETWGSEHDGASTSGWKLGVSKSDSSIIT